MAELGPQAARPQTSPGGEKPSAPLDHEELDPDGQKAYHSVSTKRERRNQAYGNEVLMAAAEREKPELRIEKIRGTVNPADLMTKHLDGKRLVMLCELLNIKRVEGRPTSAPKLTIDTEYISRASRALAAVTLVTGATASEIAVHSGAMQETWIDGYRTDGCTVTGWMLVGIVTCCILMGFELLWRKKLGESSIWSTMRREHWKRVNVIMKSR